ncbi:hypothetical protein [Nonlabens ponticola]|uniref:Uncharacterized protein n=1 Tax=Nonlabens ponticola TaxID=2496866 RepID=A0A3S9MXY1_9FLAO|nr:hypothetical protein [Nonlabens ponticola]AZQ43903.1 hypothetical protein EJ995_06535 [Nonlabens ponticola]
MKTITIPQSYTVGNQTFTTESSLEVPCDFPEPTGIEVIEPPYLAEFSYEIESFEFIPDTGNNTRYFNFSIRMNNLSDEDVTGVPILTTRSDEITGSGPFFRNIATNNCTSIEANSNCLFTVDYEESLIYGIINEYEILDVDYVLTN